MFVFVSDSLCKFYHIFVLTVDNKLILNELSLNYFNLTLFFKKFYKSIVIPTYEEVNMQTDLPHILSLILIISTDIY